MVASLDGAQVVAWVCLIVGIGVLGVGVYVGLVASTSRSTSNAKEELDRATEALEEAQQRLDDTQSELEAASRLESVGDPTALAAELKDHASAATEAATKTADAAKSALQQVGSIVGSLPEHLRFAGLLVLVGAVLMSVATIQFGGTSLF